MGEAFEAACQQLHDAGKVEVVRKLLAERIIAAASRGELDPILLQTAALSWIISHPTLVRRFALGASPP